LSRRKLEPRDRARLFISRAQSNTTSARTFRKLDVKSRTQLLAGSRRSARWREGSDPPMIDVYAAAARSAHPCLGQKLDTELMMIEQVPDIPCSGRTRPHSCTSSLVGAVKCRRRQHMSASKSSRTPVPSMGQATRRGEPPHGSRGGLAGLVARRPHLGPPHEHPTAGGDLPGTPTRTRSSCWARAQMQELQAKEESCSQVTRAPCSPLAPGIAPGFRAARDAGSDGHAL